MQEKFLPLGTICKLKGAIQKVAITGFCMKNEHRPDKIFDYVGCYYPQGVVDINKNVLFDHEQIEKIVYMGFVCEEETEFKNKIKEILEKENGKQQEYDPLIYDMDVPVATFVTEE